MDRRCGDAGGRSGGRGEPLGPVPVSIEEVQLRARQDVADDRQVGVALDAGADERDAGRAPARGRGRSRGR